MPDANTILALNDILDGDIIASIFDFYGSEERCTMEGVQRNTLNRRTVLFLVRLYTAMSISFERRLLVANEKETGNDFALKVVPSTSSTCVSAENILLLAQISIFYCNRATVSCFISFLYCTLFFEFKLSTFFHQFFILLHCQ